VFKRLGVRWRLLLAFLGICGFSGIAAASGMYFFAELSTLLRRITEERVPPALASLELSRQAERIVAAAPAVLSAASRSQHREVSRSIAAEIARLETLLQHLKSSVIAPGALASVEPVIGNLRGNLNALDALVADRLEMAERKQLLLRKLSRTDIAAQRLVAPGILVMDARVAEWRRVIEDSGPDRNAGDGAASQLASDLIGLLPQQKTQIELSAANDTLIKLAAADTLADLPLLTLPLQRALTNLAILANDVDEKLRPRLIERIGELRSFTDGPESISAIREKELISLAKAESLLSENVALSHQVSDALDQLVDAANQDISAVTREALSAQRLGSAVLIGILLLSLVSSGLIVWGYVHHNLIARLTMLSNSMLAIADGNLRVQLPTVAGDEIGRMAEALAVFRDTAIEVEDKNLREVHQARQRLIDAIESISEGFAFYDAGDRLQLCNSRYPALLYGRTGGDLEPGMTFETVVRRSVELGLIEDSVEHPERYIQARLAQHHDPGSPILQRRTDGRWILITERRVTGGGTVAIYSDITELKQRELALEEANQRTLRVVSEINRKNQELEILSNKLSKYLSPQVYDSIFSGRQEVKIASRRKKITVFFSDIVGFTEATDKMESEDLTIIINQYLTEMSNIALEYGATIDKYIGDAIMVFFGDPETRGIKEDASACTKMAIAMQKRMQELARIWRNAGVERVLECRIGISTGYCTVGNFGSEDRMDYTIIGAAVNLASRLEHAAPPGGILISNETYAHVKDEVRCEKRGEIRVKGFAELVPTYEAIDLFVNLRSESWLFHEDEAHLKLDLDLAAMSDDERVRAAEVLRRALEHLGADPK
jgi:adenylate cyclase